MSDAKPRGRPCERCNGTGRIVGLSFEGAEQFFPCEDCRGTGRKLTPEEIAEEIAELERLRGER